MGSWERLLYAHKAIGWLFLCTVVGHGICWNVVYKEQGFLWHDTFQVPLYFPSNGVPMSRGPQGDNFTIPIAFWMTLLMILGLGLLAQPLVRRQCYELFLAAHHLVS